MVSRSCTAWPCNGIQTTIRSGRTFRPPSGQYSTFRPPSGQDRTFRPPSGQAGQDLQTTIRSGRTGPSDHHQVMQDRTFRPPSGQAGQDLQTNIRSRQNIRPPLQYPPKKM